VSFVWRCLKGHGRTGQPLSVFLRKKTEATTEFEKSQYLPWEVWSPTTGFRLTKEEKEEQMQDNILYNFIVFFSSQYIKHFQGMAWFPP
jgi:hypothetical protein